MIAGIILFLKFQEYVVRKNSSGSTLQSTSFNRYELNLVLKDGRRFYVLDHGEKHLLIEEAKKLSQRLGRKSVWNAIYF